MKRTKRTAALGLTAVAVTALGMLGAGTASAEAGDIPSPTMAATSVEPTSSSAALAAPTPQNGVCEVGEFCLYFLPGLQGSLADFTTSVPNYDAGPTCFSFRGPGAGSGECIADNVGSVWNRSSTIVRVFSNTNFSGPSESIPPNTALDNVTSFPAVGHLFL